MAKGSKSPPTRIRRNVDRNQDPYLPRLAPGEVAVCRECHAIYQRRHWALDEKQFRRLSSQRTTRVVLCPACQKIRDGYPEGEVTLRGSFAADHHEEVMNRIRNEEERARGMNPLERIISICEDDDGVIRVTTTNEKLAQRIGRALHRAYQGTVKYKWSEDTKFLRVDWSRSSR